MLYDMQVFNKFCEPLSDPQNETSIKIMENYI